MNQMHDHNPPMGHAAHDHHAMMIQDFRKRFYVVLVLTVPILLLSPMIQQWLHLILTFTGATYSSCSFPQLFFFMRQAFPYRLVGRNERPQPGHDDPHWLRYYRRLHL